MEIKSLATTDVDTIIKAFTLAFADYDIQPNAEELKAMWKRRGLNPALSFAAFEAPDIVAFTLDTVSLSLIREMLHKSLSTSPFEEKESPRSYSMKQAN